MYPCIWCNNNAKEVADLYISVFPNTKVISENPVVVLLSIADQNLMLLNGGGSFKPTPALSLMYLSSSAPETEALYNKLIDGGKALMQLDAYPFSEKYAWVDDKFGVSWQLYTGKAEDIVQRIVPTLMFVSGKSGLAREASEFYMSIFPNSKSRGMLEYKEGEEDKAGYIKHGEFFLNDYLIGIMDSSFDHQFDFTEAVSIVVNCKDQEEIDRYWSALTGDGGTESMCGWLKDKYGISWQIIPENIASLIRSQKGGEALMKMKKINIAALEAANS